ncbi:hypothetical protein [Paraburkholderia sediminicola]|uniref:hypothetical protein n=1 Tax=Paraburkholderia sediminicola TaxID=458836 RepID=UPI0038BC2ACE
MNTKTVSVLASKWAAAVRQRPVLSGGLALSAVAAVMLLSQLDFSRDLSPREAAGLRQFVIDTDSSAVRSEFNAGVRDGRISLEHARAVLEAAKRQPPQYGLASDQP